MSASRRKPDKPKLKHPLINVSTRPKKPEKRVDVQYSDQSGCWHLFLVFPDGTHVEVSQHCDEAEAEQAAADITRFAQS